MVALCMLPRPTVRLDRAVVDRAKVRRAAEEGVRRGVVPQGGERRRDTGGGWLPVEDVAFRVGKAALAIGATFIRPSTPSKSAGVRIRPALTAEAVILVAVVRERGRGRQVSRWRRNAIPGDHPVIAAGVPMAELAEGARR
jgi:hypothetical protein